MDLNEIKYIIPEDLVKIIDIIQNFDYPHEEEIPYYDKEPEKIDDYFSLIDRLKNDTYYPDIHSKASNLFLNINGHYFFNGNKRLAVFSLTFFLENNGLHPISLEKSEYSKIIVDIFGNHTLIDYPSFIPTDFAMYNLALITADFNKDGVNFDDGKNCVEQFLKLVFK